MDFDPNKLFTVGLIVVIALVLVVVVIQIFDIFGTPTAQPTDVPPGVYMPDSEGMLIQDDEGSTGEVPMGQAEPYVKDDKPVPFTYTVPGREGLWYEKWYDVKAGKSFARGKDGQTESPYRDEYK